MPAHWCQYVIRYTFDAAPPCRLDPLVRPCSFVILAVSHSFRQIFDLKRVHARSAGTIATDVKDSLARQCNFFIAAGESAITFEHMDASGQGTVVAVSGENDRELSGQDSDDNGDGDDLYSKSLPPRGQQRQPRC